MKLFLLLHLLPNVLFTLSVCFIFFTLHLYLIFHPFSLFFYLPFFHLRHIVFLTFSLSVCFIFFAFHRYPLISSFSLSFLLFPTSSSSFHCLIHVVSLLDFLLISFIPEYFILIPFFFISVFYFFFISSTLSFSCFLSASFSSPFSFTRIFHLFSFLFYFFFLLLHLLYMILFTFSVSFSSHSIFTRIFHPLFLFHTLFPLFFPLLHIVLFKISASVSPCLIFTKYLILSPTRHHISPKSVRTLLTYLVGSEFLLVISSLLLICSHILRGASNFGPLRSAKEPLNFHGPNFGKHCYISPLPSPPFHLPVSLYRS